MPRREGVRIPHPHTTTYRVAWRHRSAVALRASQRGLRTLVPPGRGPPPPPPPTRAACPLPSPRRSFGEQRFSTSLSRWPAPASAPSWGRAAPHRTLVVAATATWPPISAAVRVPRRSPRVDASPARLAAPSPRGADGALALASRYAAVTPRPGAGSSEAGRIALAREPPAARASEGAANLPQSIGRARRVGAAALPAPVGRQVQIIRLRDPGHDRSAHDPTREGYLVPRDGRLRLGASFEERGGPARRGRDAELIPTPPSRPRASRLNRGSAPAFVRHARQPTVSSSPTGRPGHSRADPLPIHAEAVVTLLRARSCLLGRALRPVRFAESLH